MRQIARPRQYPFRENFCKTWFNQGDRATGARLDPNPFALAPSRLGCLWNQSASTAILRRKVAITHMASWPIGKPRPSPPIKFPRHGRAHMTGSPIDDEKFLLVSYLIGVRHLRAPLEARMRRSHLPVGQDHLGLPSPRVSMRSRRCRAICLNLLNLVLQLPKNGVGHLQNHRSHLLRRKSRSDSSPQWTTSTRRTTIIGSSMPCANREARSRMSICRRQARGAATSRGTLTRLFAPFGSVISMTWLPSGSPAATMASHPRRSFAGHRSRSPNALPFRALLCKLRERPSGNGRAIWLMTAASPTVARERMGRCP